MLKAEVNAARGDQAMVPFAPRTDRPVYCSTCFDKVRAGQIEAQVVPAASCPFDLRD